MSTGITCTPLIDVKSILGPILMSRALKGEEFDISPLIDVYVGQEIVQSLLSNINLPPDFADFGDIICLQIGMEQVKAIQALLKGEEYTFDISKVIDLIVNLNLMSAIGQALGGGTSTGTTQS